MFFNSFFIKICKDVGCGRIINLFNNATRTGTEKLVLNKTGTGTETAGLAWTRTGTEPDGQMMEPQVSTHYAAGSLPNPTFSLATFRMPPRRWMARPTMSPPLKIPRQTQHPILWTWTETMNSKRRGTRVWEQRGERTSALARMCVCQNSSSSKLVGRKFYTASFCAIRLYITVFTAI